jgi:hypothetical protein
MAQLALLDWQPNPLSSLPFLTTVTFNAASDGPAIGYRIVYELQSVHLQFQMPPGAQLPKEESDASSPVPTATERTPKKIVDRIDEGVPARMLATLVKRGLALERVAGGAPGIVFLSVTVFELDAAGSPRLPRPVITSIALAFGV